MELKRLKINNINQCTQLFRKVFEADPWHDQWKTDDRAKQYLKDIFKTPGYRGYQIKYDKKIVGGVVGHIIKWWQGDEFYIREFFIDPKYQGQGLGKKLYHFMKEQLASETVETIILMTDHDKPAYAFYKNLGLKINEKNVMMYDG
jgi:ribosomal protein S18 acetylase RimI-like enzyme